MPGRDEIQDPLVEAARSFLSGYDEKSLTPADIERAYRSALSGDDELARRWLRGSGAEEEGDPPAEDSPDVQDAGRDAGQVLLEAAQGLVEAGEAVDISAGFRLAAQRAPAVYACYSAGRPLPEAVTRRRTSGRQVSPGLEPGRTQVRRHYSQLSTQEKAQELRKLRQGEQPRSGATLVHKLSAGPEGGFYEVVGS